MKLSQAVKLYFSKFLLQIINLFKLIVSLAHGQLDQQPDTLACPPDTMLSGPETDFCGSKCSERYCCDSDKGWVSLGSEVL